jgi:hypothetical protein
MSLLYLQMGLDLLNNGCTVRASCLLGILFLNAKHHPLPLPSRKVTHFFLCFLTTDDWGAALSAQP